MAIKCWKNQVPTRCQVCDNKIGVEFVDGKIKNGGWAIMCENCHNKIGIGLGLGRGQRYQKTLIDGSYIWVRAN